MLDFAGVPGYEILRGFRQPVRSENVSESWCAQALPIREDETRKMIEYAGRVLAMAPRDGTRHEAIFVSFGPGTGKTSFMISAAEALDELAFIQTRRRPLVMDRRHRCSVCNSILSVPSLCCRAASRHRCSVCCSILTAERRATSASSAASACRAIQ